MAWMSRITLELIGRAGVGRSLDSLEGDQPGPYGEAMKSLLCVEVFPWLVVSLVHVYIANDYASVPLSSNSPCGESCFR